MVSLVNLGDLRVFQDELYGRVELIDKLSVFVFGLD